MLRALSSISKSPALDAITVALNTQTPARNGDFSPQDLVKRPMVGHAAVPRNDSILGLGLETKEVRLSRIGNGERMEALNTNLRSVSGHAGRRRKKKKKKSNRAQGKGRQADKQASKPQRTEINTHKESLGSLLGK